MVKKTGEWIYFVILIILPVGICYVMWQRSQSAFVQQWASLMVSVVALLACLLQTYSFESIINKKLSGYEEGISNIPALLTQLHILENESVMRIAIEHVKKKHSRLELAWYVIKNFFSYYIFPRKYSNEFKLFYRLEASTLNDSMIRDVIHHIISIYLRGIRSGTVSNSCIVYIKDEQVESIGRIAIKIKQDKDNKAGEMLQCALFRLNLIEGDQNSDKLIYKLSNAGSIS